MLLVGILAFFVLNAFGQLVSNHKVVFYSPKTFQGHNQTWQTLQTNNGVMYFANGDGLLNYDGSAWSLSLTAMHTNMLSVGVDQNERIYYGAIGEVGYFEKDRFGGLHAVQITNDEWAENMLAEFYWDIHVFENRVIFRAEHLFLIYEDDKC